MKRTIVVFLGAWLLVSCNDNESTKTTPAEDSTAMVPKEDTALVSPGHLDMTPLLELTTPAFIRQQYSYEELYTEWQFRQQWKGLNRPRPDTLPPFLLKRKGLSRLTEKQLIITLDQIQREKLAIYGTYGDDNRMDPYNTTPAIKQLAGKVGLIIDTGQLIKRADGSYMLRQNGDLKSSYTTCDGEHFDHQPVVKVRGSGFAIRDTVMVTAGHCLGSTDFKRYYIVFGYRMEDSLKANLLIKAADVYTIGRVANESAADDYCVFITNRPLPRERVLPVSIQTPAVLDSVYSIGYGLGLPVKVAARAFVRSFSPVGGFICNLDVYTGDSGSPVFRQDSVIGVLTGGIRNFRYRTKDQCRISFRCDDWDCEGETVTSASRFMRGPL